MYLVFPQFWRQEVHVEVLVGLVPWASPSLACKPHLLPLSSNGVFLCVGLDPRHLSPSALIPSSHKDTCNLGFGSHPEDFVLALITCLLVDSLCTVTLWDIGDQGFSAGIWGQTQVSHNSVFLFYYFTLSYVMGITKHSTILINHVWRTRFREHLNTDNRLNWMNFLNHLN